MATSPGRVGAHASCEYAATATSLSWGCVSIFSQNCASEPEPCKRLGLQGAHEGWVVWCLSCRTLKTSRRASYALVLVKYNKFNEVKPKIYLCQYGILKFRWHPSCLNENSFKQDGCQRNFKICRNVHGNALKLLWGLTSVWGLKLLVWKASRYSCMRPQAPTVWGLQLLVHETWSYQCMRPQTTSVCGLMLLVYAALSY